MSILYVPLVVPPTPPSRRAKELSQLLEQVIRDYERTHASVSPAEIREAFMLAQRRSGGMDPQRMVGVAVGLAALLAAGVMAFVGKGGLQGAVVLPWLEIVFVLVLVIGVVAVLLHRRP